MYVAKKILLTSTVYSSNDSNKSGLVKILRFLQAHDSEYLSGQDLSDVLHISRVAVWKYIKRLRMLGYFIESKQKIGYKLVGKTDKLLPWEITVDLKTRLLGHKAYYTDTLDSTQNYALAISNNPTNDGAIIIAQKQTSGKGRSHGRKWISPEGGIWLSLIMLNPKFDISAMTIFPVGVAIALSKAAEEIMGIRLETRWPNDLTIHGKKVAGIIVDASVESNKVKRLLLGVGINFDVDTSHIETQLKNTTNFYGATSLVKEVGINRVTPMVNTTNVKTMNTDQIRLIQKFLVEIENICDVLVTNRTYKIIKEWIHRTHTIGQTIRVDVEEKTITGEIVGMDSTGALIINPENGSKPVKIMTGDIVYMDKHKNH